MSTDLSFTWKFGGKAIFSTQYLKQMYLLSLVTLHSLRWLGEFLIGGNTFLPTAYFCCFSFFKVTTEYFFHWSITALQCYVDFCCIETCINYSIHISPPSTSTPIPASTSPQSTKLSSLWHTVASHYFTHGSIHIHIHIYIYIYIYISVLISQFTLPSLHAHISISLHLCVSIPALQIGSSVPFS